jgi:intracellular multiplication protein IcmK
MIGGGIPLPAPPPASAFSGDPTQLAQQAEQAAIAAQAQAEIDQAKAQKEHNLKSYDRASSGLLPMSPDQIREFMHKLENSQEAAVPPFAGQPTGQVRINTLSLDPGNEPPEVNLSAGYVTTINMVDVTGEPWPILDVGVGGNFEVSPTTAGTHVVRIMPLSRFGSGDLSVLLKDLPTPVIFRLTAGGPNVDLRYDARIAKMGPNAKSPLIDRPRLEAGNQTIMMILENAPPSGAKRLKVGGMDGRTLAWSLDGHTYVRTPLTLLSPAWDASVSSADGMTVYEIGDAPVLLMSDNGAVVRARLTRDDDHDK